MAYVPFLFFVFFFVQASLGAICVDNDHVYQIADRDFTTRSYYGVDFFRNYGFDRDFYGKNFYGKNFFNKDVYNKDFYGKDFNGQVYNKDFYGKDFYGKDFYGKNFYGRDVYGKNFYDKNFYGKDFYGNDVAFNTYRKDYDNGMNYGTVGYTRNFLKSPFFFSGYYNKDFLGYNKDYSYGYNKDFLGYNKDYTYGFNKDYTHGYNKDYTVGYNKDLYQGYGNKYDTVYNKDYNMVYNRYGKDFDNFNYGKTFNTFLNRYYKNDFDYSYNRYDDKFYNYFYGPKTVGDVDYRRFYDFDFQTDVQRTEVDKTYRMDFFKDTFGVVKSAQECDCVCPSFLPKGDLHNPVFLDLTITEIVNKLWNNKNFPRLTINGKRMKNAILYLVNSDNPIYRRHAFIMTTYFFSYYPHIDLKIDMCPLAQFIDATIAYKKTHDVKLLHDAVDSFAAFDRDSTRLIFRTSQYHGQCQIYNPLITRRECQGDGTVYQFEEMWSMEGGSFPAFYRDVAFDLYHSDLYVDKMMATMATVTLSPQFYEYHKNFDMNMWIEYLRVLNFDVLPSCCCGFMSHRMQELYTMVDQQIIHSVEYFKGIYSV